MWLQKSNTTPPLENEHGNSENPLIFEKMKFPIETWGIFQPAIVVSTTRLKHMNRHPGPWVGLHRDQEVVCCNGQPGGKLSPSEPWIFPVYRGLHPGRWTAGTYRSPIWKGKWSSRPSWLCSMLIFRGVYYPVIKGVIISHCKDIPTRQPVKVRKFEGGTVELQKTDLKPKCGDIFGSWTWTQPLKISSEANLNQIYANCFPTFPSTIPPLQNMDG